MRRLCSLAQRDRAGSDTRRRAQAEKDEDPRARLQQTGYVDDNTARRKRANPLTTEFSPPPWVRRRPAVLQLITFPNLLLTYAQHFLLPAAAAATESKAPDADEEPTEPATDDSSTRPGELEVSPEFLDSFESFLARENIDLRFFEGDWAGMDKAIRAGGDDDELYDLVLTSETLYSVPSLGPLIDLLEAATTRADFSGGGGGSKGSSCLVACKRIYFGVGGGELEFRRRVEERGAQVESVWGEGEGKGKNSGVGRTVLSVRWSKRSKKEVL